MQSPSLGASDESSVTEDGGSLPSENSYINLLILRPTAPHPAHHFTHYQPLQPTLYFTSSPKPTTKPSICSSPPSSSLLSTALPLLPQLPPLRPMPLLPLRLPLKPARPAATVPTAAVATTPRSASSASGCLLPAAVVARSVSSPTVHLTACK